MYQEIQIGRLYEKIVEQIEARILSGELKPGDKLPPERELTRQFGVSRTAVREAMKALTQKGLVEIQAGRGTFVTNGTSQVMRNSLGLLLKIGQAEGVRDLVEVREILEPEIAALAAVRAREEQIIAMQEALAVMERSIQDVDTFIEADLDFHLALAEGSQNALILLLVDTLVELLRELRICIAKVEGGILRAHQHHQRILQAVLERDPEAARAAMHAHLQQIHADSEASLQIKS
jgi:GntR family transcriptional repressor for pyruvate dehydrogenase complex